MTTNTDALRWTKPFYGVSHLGYNPRKNWATIVDYGRFVILQKWFPGCGFEPIEEDYTTIPQAKRAARTWVRQSFNAVKP